LGQSLKIEKFLGTCNNILAMGACNLEAMLREDSFALLVMDEICVLSGSVWGHDVGKFAC
jgi:hypothetical protein